ncbi:MaoC/PaaZ C-terminal domain-containing protein [Oceanobacillus halophilus]|nr:MaoC/PaaZ C-terminal domain-containing protein [Oceanobacillus halophilus]
MTVIDMDSLQEGQELQSLTKPAISKVQLVKYAGASGDFNPLHTDDAFAQQIGMDGVIAHGMLIMGFMGEYMMNIAGEIAEPTQFSMRFGAMSRPGDVITCTGKVEKIFEKDGKRFVSIQLRAQKSSEEVVGTGKCELRFF